LKGSDFKMPGFFINHVGILIKRRTECISETGKQDCIKCLYEGGKIIFNICKSKSNVNEQHILTKDPECHKMLMKETFLSFDNFIGVCLKTKIINVSVLDSFLRLNIENGESGTKIFVILKLLKVLKLIKDCGIVSEWSYHRHNKRSFFNIIFEHVNKVEKEVLTGTKLYGFSNNLEAEGLYQIILTQVSSLVIGLHHGEDFNHFERFLLKSIITDKHSQLSFVLATDLLCFVARLSSANVCYEQTKFVLQLIEVSPADKQITFAPLFRRLFNFLDSNAQEKLVEDYLSSFSTNDQPRLLLLLLLGKQAFSMFKREDFFKEFNLLIKSFTVELKTWFDDTTVITKELIVIRSCRKLNHALENVSHERLSELVEEKSASLTALKELHDLVLKRIQLFIFINDDNSNAGIMFSCLSDLISKLVKLKLFRSNEVCYKILEKIENNKTYWSNSNVTVTNAIVSLLSLICCTDIPSEYHSLIVKSWNMCFVTSKKHNWLRTKKIIDEFQIFSNTTTHTNIIDDVSQVSPELLWLIKLQKVEVPFPEKFEEVLKNMNELRKSKVLQQNNKVLCEASEYLINLVSNQLSSFQVNEFNDSSLNKFENALTIANHWIASFK